MVLVPQLDPSLRAWCFGAVLLEGEADHVVADGSECPGGEGDRGAVLQEQPGEPFSGSKAIGADGDLGSQ